MIKLTRLNGSELYLNQDLIKSIEEKPDTTIELINGDRILVREQPAEIIDRIIAFRLRIVRLAGGDAQTTQFNVKSTNFFSFFPYF